MNSNSMGIGLILVAVLLALVTPFYPDKYQDKMFDLAGKIILVGATLTTTIQPRGQKESDKNSPKNPNS